MKRRTGRILLKVALLAAGLLFVLAIVNTFAYDSRFTPILVGFGVALFLFIVAVVFIPDRGSYEATQVPERLEPKTVVRWGPSP